MPGEGERLRDRLRDEQREFAGDVSALVGGEFGPGDLALTSGVLRPVVEVESVAAKASIVKGRGLVSGAVANVAVAGTLLEPVPCLCVSCCFSECLPLLCFRFESPI